MRKGYYSELRFDAQGEIFAFATGSDATSEHEQGSKKMQDMLCDPLSAREPPGALQSFLEKVGAVKPPPLTDDELIAALRAGKKVKYPELLKRKILSRNLDYVHFISGVENGTPVAILGFTPSGLRALPLDHPELRLTGDHVSEGAWDERSFAIKVRGEELVAKLKRFADEVKAGNSLFAGTFLKSQGSSILGGVMVARKDKLQPEHYEAIAKAQAEWEANLRLKAQSRVSELQALVRGTKERHVRLPGHIWPVWKDGVDSAVVYALNPSNDRDAQYYGPYEFDDLKNWSLAQEKFKLTPIARA